MDVRKGIRLLAIFVALAAISAGCRAAERDGAILAYAKAADYYDAGNLESAIVSVAESLRADGSFYPALLLYGKASYLADDEATAIANLKRAVSVSPRSGEAALWLARSYRIVGDNASAKHSCELVLSSDPSDVAALRLASLIAFDEDDAAKGIYFLDRAIDASGETGLAFIDRAAIRWAAGNADGAIADLDAALSTLPIGSASHQAAAALRTSIWSTSR
jgi:tetratricopeptide (TPR) repeat protein